jgi:7-carboxy-7-deazaguanine synthase
MTTKLRITEIFYSLQGETRTTGIPCVFIRLTGCPLRCSWCDTEYSFNGGTLLELQQILTTVKSYSPKYVTVTGGEPLAQKNCILLLKLLADAGYQVSLETSGAMCLKEVDHRVVKVMDIKPPKSGESHRNNYNNIALLNYQDQVKFVIADRTDYDWAVSKLIAYDLESKVADVLFSPVANVLKESDLANWIIEDRLNVRFQMQLHRFLWGDKQGV